MDCDHKDVKNVNHFGAGKEGYLLGECVKCGKKVRKEHGEGVGEKWILHEDTLGKEKPK